MKESKACRRETDAVELVFMASERWDGRRPEGPGAEANGNDWIMCLICSSLSLTLAASVLCIQYGVESGMSGGM